MRLIQQMILLILVALLSCYSLRAATINVPADQATINGAIGVAAASDSIIVAAGTYNEDVNVSKTVIIQLNGNISILSLAGIAGSTVNIQANTLTVSGTTSTTYSGQITGTGKLIKGGTSTLTLLGDNSFGSVDANQGILAVAPTGTTALGTLKIASATAGTLRVDSGTVTAAAVQDGGVSSLVIGNGAMTVANGIAIDVLRVGYTNGTAVTGSLTVSSGAVVIGSGTEILDIGRPEANVVATGTANFSAASSVTINVADVRIGVTTVNPGGATGSLTLSASGANTITSTTLVLGDSTGAGNTGTESVLTLGANNTINTNTFIVANRKSRGAVVFASAGGTLTLRGKNGAGNNCNLRIGYNNNNTGTSAVGRFEMAGSTFNAEIDVLILGYHEAGAGDGKGTLTFSAGTIQVNTVELAHPNANGTSTTPANTTGTITQTGGDLRAVTIRKFSGVSTYNWSAGKIRNRTNSNLTNESVPIALLTATAHVIEIDGGRTGTIQAAAVLSDVGSLHLNGGGTLFLPGTNTYTGGTTINGGVLSLTSIGASGANGPIGTGNITFNNGTLQYTGTGESTNRTVTLNNSGFINVDPATQLTLTGIVSGSSINSLNKVGTGDLTLSAANTFGGWVQVDAGRLICDNAASIGVNANTSVVVMSGASLCVQGGINLSGKSIILNGTGVGSAGALINLSGNNTVSSNIFLGSNSTITSTNGGDTLALSGGIIANYGLTFNGAGNITVGGIIDGATGFAAGLNETRFHGNFNTTTAPIGGFVQANLTGRAPEDNRLTNNGTPGPWGNNDTWVYTGQIYDADGIFSLAENIDDNVLIKINGVSRMGNGSSWDVVTNTAQVDGLRSGNVTITNANPQGGTTNFGAGGWFDIELRFGNGGGGAGPVVFNNWTATKGFGYSASASTSFDGNNFTIPIGGLTNVDGNLRTAVSNSVTKSGTGVLTLSNANTYAGPTAVSSGTLVISNTTGSATGSGLVTVSAGATVSGTGTIAGSLNSNGIVSPAGSASGTLTLGGSFTLGATGSLLVQIDGTGVSDQLVVGGDVSIDTAAVLNATAVNTIHGSTITLVNNNGVNGVTGNFNGLADSAALTLGARPFVIRYTVGSNNNEIQLIDDTLPLFLASSQNIDEGETVTPLAASDTDGDLLTFSIISGALPNGITLNTDGTFSGNSTFVSQGTYTPVIRVTDAVNGFKDATITIVVADVGFSVADATVNETAGVVTISVVRSGAGTLAASVRADTVAVTAIAGLDYLTTSIVLNWLAGETGIKTFTVPILNDSSIDFGESFNIVLSNPVNGMLSDFTGTVLIVDDESFPVAVPDTVNAGQGKPLIIAVLGNDLGLGNTPVVVTINLPPTNGSVSVNSGNTIVYTSNASFVGSDSFVYRVTDSQGQSSTATVSVTVKPPSIITSLPVIEPNPVIAGNPVAGMAASDTGTIVWNWGDGLVSTGNTVSHTYSAPGNYTVQVNATSSEGLVTTYTLSVFVSLDYGGSNGVPSGGVFPTGVTGILVGGAGAGAAQGGTGKVTCNYVRRDKTTYMGSLGQLSIPAQLTQADLLNLPSTLTIGVSGGAVFKFDLGKNGKGKATGLPLIEFSVKRQRFKFKARREDLTELTEVLGGPRKFELNRKSPPIMLLVPVTLQIGDKVFLAMTFQVSYKQINGSGKGLLAK